MSDDPIKHVIVLMLENRSFDHMLGAVAKDQPFEGIDAAAPKTNAYRGVTYAETASANRIFSPDPKHNLPDVLAQMDVEGDIPQMDGFVASFAQSDAGMGSAEYGRVMDYFPDGTLPVLHQLAKEFALCDHWFSSIPGPTWPNRLFAMTGTSLGKVTMPGLIMDFGIHWYDQTTVFDRLDEKKIDWRVYFDDVSYSLILVHQWAPQNAVRHRPMMEFYADIAKAQKDEDFPGFVWIEPAYFLPGASDYHPPHDVFDGEELVAKVYNALRASSLWDSTLLVILFDEHGGIYDHVPPPSTVPPDHHQDEWTFNRFGVRVPAILVSPHVEDAVITDVFDHTSLLKYLIDKWGLGPLGQRAAQANSFAGAISKHSRPDTPAQLVVPAVGVQSPVTRTLTEHEQSLVGLSHALESMAGEDAEIVAARSRQVLSGAASQVDAAVDRVTAFLQHQASLKSD